MYMFFLKKVFAKIALLLPYMGNFNISRKFGRKVTTFIVMFVVGKHF